MDVLSDVIQTVVARSELLGRLLLRAPWGMAIAGCSTATFHVVTRGACWLELTDDPAGRGGGSATGPGSGAESGPWPLAGGDLVVLPQGHAHQLRDALDTPVRPLAAVLAERDARAGGGPEGEPAVGGSGAATELVCGAFTFAGPGGGQPLVAQLPPVIHVRADGGPQVQWLQATLQFLATESACTAPGASLISGRLADILLVHAIRAHMARREGSQAAGWLHGLNDPDIARSLQLIHEALDHPWSVEALARAVAMSRSAFAARFSQCVGQPPLRYLTQWRMLKAARLLREEDRSLTEIASAVGYDTQAAFSKAFKRAMGMPPGTWRGAAEPVPMPAG